MSKNLKKESKEAPDQSRVDSVYDFLYYDLSRVGSFLSQFDDSGLLTSLVAGEFAERGKSDAAELGAKVSIPAILGAKGSSKYEYHATSSQDISRSYDPRWANALTFLDYLEQNSLINRDPETAGIGQIVLLSGDLSIFDFGVLRKMWDLPTIKRMIISSSDTDAVDPSSGNRHERRKTGKASNPKSETPSQGETALEMLTALPHSTQAAISTADFSVWCTLKDENLTVPSSELLLKHGITIRGTWSVVGILDALPDTPLLDENNEPSMAAFEQLVAGSKLNTLGLLLAGNLVAPVRHFLGRPSTAFGVTPLLMFREVIK